MGRRGAGEEGSREVGDPPHPAPSRHNATAMPTSPLGTGPQAPASVLKHASQVSTGLVSSLHEFSTQNLSPHPPHMKLYKHTSRSHPNPALLSLPAFISLLTSDVAIFPLSHLLDQNIHPRRTETLFHPLSFQPGGQRLPHSGGSRALSGEGQGGFA